MAEIRWYESKEEALATGAPEEELLHEGVVWGVYGDAPAQGTETPVDPLNVPPEPASGTDG